MIDGQTQDVSGKEWESKDRHLLEPLEKADCCPEADRDNEREQLQQELLSADGTERGLEIG